MKRVYLTLKLTLINIVLLSILSCSEDDMHFDTDDSNVSVADTTMKSCNLVFNLSINEFDTPTRSSSGAWAEDDKIYLTFDNDAYGIAEYNSGSWTINYYGTLTNGCSTACIARYFDNTDFASASVVKLNATTGVYEDQNAIYLFDGSTLAINAVLSPKTGRIRFKGDPSSSIAIQGVTHPSSFSIATGLLTETTGKITLTVTDEGYTPYVYGYFTDSETPWITLYSTTSVFSRSCSTSIFKTGESGYMDIPTEESHIGWMNSLSFKINEAKFTMIPVNKESDLFCLGETEVTEELYAAVMETVTSTTKFPRLFYSHSECETFINKLNELTNHRFRLPTKDEWQYAAKGGKLSQNYTYSGSNLISEVAWFSDNSNEECHNVALLIPNELGFYDMSGNVAEWTSTSVTYTEWFDGWSHQVVGYNYCGGSYKSSEDSCTNTSTGYSQSHSYCGLRLALSIN